MLAPNDRTLFAYPGLLYSAQEYVRDSNTLMERLLSDDYEPLNPESLANIRKLIEHAHEVTTALLGLTEAYADAPLAEVVFIEEAA